MDVRIWGTAVLQRKGKQRGPIYPGHSHWNDLSWELFQHAGVEAAWLYREDICGFWVRVLLHDASSP